MTPDDLDILPFNLRSATNVEYEALCAFRIVGMREVIPDTPDIPTSEWIPQIRALSESTECGAWAAWDGDGKAILGFGEVFVDQSGANPNVARFDISVDPSRRRRGLASYLLRLITEFAAARDRKLLWSQSNDRCPAGAAFLDRIGAKKLSESHTNRLLLAELDRDLIERWMGYPRDSSLRIAVGEWDGPFPEERLQEISDFYQTLYDSEPRLEGIETGSYHFTPQRIREGDERGLTGGKKRLIVYVASSEDDRLLGLTEIVWHPTRPKTIFQNYTAMLPQFRKRGLGRRLKAEMLVRILRDLPEAESIRSGNDDSNAAILKLNHELGFKPYIARTNWQAETEKIVEYLSALNPQPPSG